MPIHCCICKQKGEQNVRSLFSIPKEPHIQREWLRFCNIEEKPDANYVKYRVCNDHFVSSDIKKMYPRPLLRKGAIPCIRNILDERIQEHQYQSIASVSSSDDQDMENPGPSKSRNETNQNFAAYKRLVKKYLMRHQRLQKQKCQNRTTAAAQLIEQSKRFLNPITHALFATQLRLSNIKKSWT